MSVWVSIDHAPRDRPLDLWGEDQSPEMNRSLMMSPMPRRWPACRWSPRVLRNSGLLMNLPDGWYFQRVYAREPRADNEQNWCRIWATHYMEISDGPTTS